MHERFSREVRCGPPGPRHRRRHWSGRHFGRGGPRARRGDVRAAVLALLGERPMHGYEMIQELEERTGGVWRPSAGSIYPTLQLLEDEGLIKGEESEGKSMRPAGAFTLSVEPATEAAPLRVLITLTGAQPPTLMAFSM